MGYGKDRGRGVATGKTMVYWNFRFDRGWRLKAPRKIPFLYFFLYPFTFNICCELGILEVRLSSHGSCEWGRSISNLFGLAKSIRALLNCLPEQIDPRVSNSLDPAPRACGKRSVNSGEGERRLSSLATEKDLEDLGSVHLL